ncbi:MAG: PA-IL-like protein [Acidobacteria bacterium OLB17]|nr:MAG: PA-IL-like protein [Acidobacteria bacterium OLB17]MCZ2391482.1 LecA/PA-IL family lectin [Acidobacteriota bacterium]
MFRVIIGRISFLLILGAVCASLAFADTIKLKDGSLFKGTIVSFANGKFTIVMGTGAHQRTMTFSADEVESIKFEDESAAIYNSQKDANAEPAATPRPQISSPRVITTDNTRPATVIGSSTRPSQPSNERPSKPSNTANAKPISWTVKVLADNTANGWTNTGFVVRKGQRIRVTANGTVSLGKGKTSSASGEPDIDDPNKLLKNVATGAVIAVIGDDNNDFIYIGAEREFTASRDGALFLGINEGNLDDNSGSFSAKVEIFPEGN